MAQQTTISPVHPSPHCVQLDAYGNGVTSMNDGHTHGVYGGQVAPSNFPAPHTHYLTAVQCGGGMAGVKPCNCGRR